jgi:hypothetical protein
MPVDMIPVDPSGRLREETDELSFVLRPSPLDGVGVFCTHGIRKGTRLRLFPGPGPRFIPAAKLAEHAPLAAFCRRYGLEHPEGCYVSPDFGYMEIGWYLNHSGTPNAIRDENSEFFAGRDIQAGEEITINYTIL